MCLATYTVLYGGVRAGEEDIEEGRVNENKLRQERSEKRMEEIHGIMSNIIYSLFLHGISFYTHP